MCKQLKFNFETTVNTTNSTTHLQKKSSTPMKYYHMVTPFWAQICIFSSLPAGRDVLSSQHGSSWELSIPQLLQGGPSDVKGWRPPGSTFISIPTYNYFHLSSPFSAPWQLQPTQKLMEIWQDLEDKHAQNCKVSIKSNSHTYCLGL